VLLEYGTGEHKSRGELCAALGLSSGQASRILHDDKLLKLWDQQLHLLDMGRKWRDELRLYRKVRQETFRTAAKNVEWFRRAIEAFPPVADAAHISEYFRPADWHEYATTRNRIGEATVSRSFLSHAMAVQPAELLAEIGDPPMLPRICRLTAKYAAIAAGIYPRGDRRSAGIRVAGQ